MKEVGFSSFLARLCTMHTRNARFPHLSKGEGEHRMDPTNCEMEEYDGEEKGACH